MILLQENWNDAFRNGETAWVTLKQPGEPSVHGRLQAAPPGPDQEPAVHGSDGFWARRCGADALEVGHQSSPAVYRHLLPAAELRALHFKAVTGVDVSASGLGVSCSADETLRVWESATGEVRRELSGHLGEVYTCRFFPSGVVILSGGADMQLKIWSAETGQCAATLRGHTGAVLATAIVERGRNIISAGRDGRCKLWDVGEQRCLADLCEIDSVINCVLLADLPDGLDPGSREEPPNEREVGTEGRLVAVGSEDGCVRLVAAHSRRQLTSWQLPAAVTALSCPAPGRLAAGCRDGSVCWLEVRSGRQVGAGRRSCSPVLALRPVSGRLLVARADGTVHTEEPPDGDRTDPPHTVVLCGPDCEPVYGLSDNGRQLFTAGRDCCVRRYKLPL